MRPPDFRVVGYLPTWSGEIDQIDFPRLTHVNYAFVLPTAQGDLTVLENSARLEDLVTRAHSGGVKVSISIGGWNDGNDTAFEQMAADPSRRARFVEATVAFIDRHSLDGVDIDWEYPDPGSSGAHYLALMQELRARLAPLRKLLTVAVVGDGPVAAGVPSETFAQIDFANVMAYDADEGPHGETHHSSFDYAARCLAYWQGRGLPKNKTVLGVPFYGKRPGTAYRALVARDARAPWKDEVDGILYNGVATMRRKTTLARTQASGVMIWELSEDTHDASALLRAIDEAARAAQPDVTSKRP